MAFTATDASDISRRNAQAQDESRQRSRDKMAEGIVQQVERGIRDGGHPALRAYGSYLYDSDVREEVDRRLRAVGFTIGNSALYEVDWPGKYQK